MCCILPPEMHQYQTVGVPVPSCEVKLVDGASCHLTFSLFERVTDGRCAPPPTSAVEEAGYKSSNPTPEGEIWIRGPSVTKGYCASLLPSSLPHP